MNEFVESIIGKFQVFHLRAKQEEWGLVCWQEKFQPEDIYCCGLAVMLIDQPCRNGDKHYGDSFEQAAVDLLGLNLCFVEGFIGGFDGKNEVLSLQSTVASAEAASIPFDPIQWSLGYMNGIEVWDRLEDSGMAYEGGEEDESDEDEEDEPIIDEAKDFADTLDDTDF